MSATLNDLNTQATRELIGSMVFGKAGLAEATNVGRYKTTNTVAYSIDGKVYSKPATDDIAFTAGLAVQAVSTTIYYAVCADAAGVMTTVQGTANGGFPAKNGGTALFGYIKVVTNSSTTFTPATTDLSAAGITTTYLDVSVPPLATSF